MRALVVSLLLVTLLATACTSAAQRRLHETGPAWPLGYYELVSFNGQTLPVELPNGEILRGGHCALLESRYGEMRFRVSFGYGGKPRVPRDLAPRVLDGRVVIRLDAARGARKPVRFVIEGRGEFEDGELGGVKTYAVEEEASGTLFGNELSLGTGEESVVFMRAPDPRRRRRTLSPRSPGPP
jgi:hypothetical protein